MKTTLSHVQRNAVGIVILLNLLLPFLLYPYKTYMLSVSPIAYWMFMESLSLLLPLISMWILAKRFSVSPAEYSLPLPPQINANMLGLSILVAVSIVVSYWPARDLAWALLWEYSVLPTHDFRDLLPAGIWHFPAVLGFSFEAGFFESIVFIGLPWLLLHDRCNTASRRAAFAVLSSVVFAANHRGYGLYEVAAVFFFGLVAVLWFLKLRNLWPVVFGHTAANVFGLT